MIISTISFNKTAKLDFVDNYKVIEFETSQYIKKFNIP